MLDRAATAGRAPRHQGYELIDSGGLQKLERFGEYVLVRPAAQAVWRRRDPAAWRAPHATFERDASGNGTWHGARSLPASWPLSFAGLEWQLQRNDFGHVGIFPEQAPCWRWIAEQVDRAQDAAHRASSGTSGELLNLFGYTGGSTLAASAAGAPVVHVDASKTSVRAARTNAELSGLADRPVRWIVDDVQRFVEREERRQRRYQGIVLDPPTYGRGSRGEIWQIEQHLPPLLGRLRGLLAGPDCFLLLTCHSPGFTPLVLANLLADILEGTIEHGEMVLDEHGDGRPLPSGAYARWRGAT